MISVFFDGKCGLCSKEIRYYRKIAPSGVFVWYDVATDPSPLDGIAVTQEDALRRLHATDSAGKLHKGVDAFILIWKELRGWYFLSLVARLPIIRQIAQLAYNLFADYRFKKLPHCQVFIDN